MHVSPEKARLILDQILPTELDYLLEVEPNPQLAETKSLLDLPLTRANTCLEQEKEEILFPDFILDIKPVFLFWKHFELLLYEKATEKSKRVF